LVEGVTGRDIERHVCSVAMFQGELTEMTDDNLRKYRAVFAMGRGVAWDVANTYNALAGLSITSAEQWALVMLSPACAL
ncbi:aromatic alcohol reductase, partial [Pseudomonas syringae pv. tagetis]